MNRMERLLKLRRHESDMAAVAMRRAQEKASEAEAATQAARERRREAESRMTAAAGRPQSSVHFLQQRFEVLERLDEERLQDIQERRLQRALNMRRGDLQHAMVREEQMRHLDDLEKRRRQAAEMGSEQKTLDDIRREGGTRPW